MEGNIEVEFKSGVESDGCSDRIDKSAYGRREPALSNVWACARVGNIEFGVWRRVVTFRDREGGKGPR